MTLLQYPTEQTLQSLFYVMLGTCVVGICLYMYFVSSSVMHVVVRKEAMHEVNQLNSLISNLEADYIAAQHDVSQDIAHLDGFTEVTKKIFIDRTDSTLVLSRAEGVGN